MSLAHRFLSKRGTDGSKRLGVKKFFFAVCALLVGVAVGLGAYRYFIKAPSINLLPRREVAQAEPKPKVMDNKTATSQQLVGGNVSKSDGVKKNSVQKQPHVPVKPNAQRIAVKRKAVIKKRKPAVSGTIKVAKRKKRTHKASLPSIHVSRELQLVEEATKAFKKGDYNTAIVKYKAALRLSPANRKALLNLGVIYFKLGMLKEAEEYFKRLLNLYPDDEDALNNLAVVYMQQGKYKEALNLLDRCLALDPVNKLALLNEGICYKRLGNVTKALEMFARGMKVYPNEYRFFLYAGVLLYEKGDMEGAVSLLEKAYSLMEDKNTETAIFLRSILER